MIKTKLNKKKLLIIFIPILIILIVLGILMGNKLNKKDNKPINNQETINYSYSKVYLLDDDNALIPLTCKYESKETKGEQYLYVLDLLKVDSNLASKPFKGLIPKESKINSIELNNGILDIDFNENFNMYDKKIELRLIESITWTMCDFEEINGINLKVDGNLLKNMPLCKTPLSFPITKQIGINNYLLTNAPIEGSYRVLTFYEKKINNKSYYIPVSQYVNNSNNLSQYDLTINSLFKSPGITSNLQVCKIFENTSMLQTSVFKDNILYVSLTEDILFDEASVSLEVYELLLEVTQLYEEIKDISFLMDLEEVKVNKDNEEVINVSTIILNKYYI